MSPGVPTAWFATLGQVISLSLLHVLLCGRGSAVLACLRGQCGVLTRPRVDTMPAHRSLQFLFILGPR